MLSFVLFLLSILPHAAPGFITRLSFELQHPHPSFANQYTFSFKLDTPTLYPTIFRFKFPYQIYTNSLSEILGSLIIFDSDSSCANTHNISTSIAQQAILDPNDLNYYFTFKKSLTNTTFYKIIIRLSNYPTITASTPFNPIEVYTVTAVDPLAMIIDSNTGFADVVLSSDPTNTLTAIYSNPTGTFNQMVTAENSVVFTIILSQKIDIGSMYRIFFDSSNDPEYQFSKICTCAPSTPNNNCLNYYCILSDDKKELLFFMNQTLEASNPFQIVAYVTNPSIVLTGSYVNFTVIAYQPISKLIFEYAKLQGTLYTKVVALIPGSSPQILVHYGVDVTDNSQISFINRAFKRESATSTFTAYNSLKLSFQVNTNTPYTLVTVVKLNLFPYISQNTIILTGSISHNFPPNINNNKLISGVIANDTYLGIEICNVGSLVAGTKYFISFKIFFNENTPITTSTQTISVVLCSMDASGNLHEFSEKANFPVLNIIPNTEYNQNTTYLSPRAYHYVLSGTMGAPSNDTIINQIALANKIGVFASPGTQTLLFYIVPSMVNWCSIDTSFCTLTDTTTQMFMYVDFPKKVEVSISLNSSWVLDSLANLLLQNFNYSNANFNQGHLRCTSVVVCMDLLNSIKVGGNTIKGFGFSNTILNFQNSPYVDDYLLDFVFTLGYKKVTDLSETKNTGFLYNSYVINNAYDPNIKMSFVNYIIFNNNAGNDASAFPTMIRLTMVIDSIILALNPAYFSFFFDQTLENYSLRDFVINSTVPNYPNYYSIGCNGTSKFQPFNCSTFDSKPLRNSNFDSWVQMGRIDIYYNSTMNLSLNDKIDIYIPFTINGKSSLETPTYFSLGVWNATNNFVGAFRLAGSRLDVSSPIIFNFGLTTAEFLNTSSYSSVNGLNPQYRIQSNSNIYANNIVDLLALSDQYASDYLQPNSGYNLGSGFMVTSSYDIFFNSQAYFSEITSECIKLSYSYVNIKKYVVFCPYDDGSQYGGNIAGMGIHFNSSKIPLDWYKYFTLPICSHTFTWSNNSGQLFGGVCGSLTVANTNPNLTIATQNLPGKYRDCASFVISTDANFSCKSAASCFIQISFTFTAAVSVNDAFNKTGYMMDNRGNKFTCSYNVSSSASSQIIINNISSDSTGYVFEMSERIVVFLMDFPLFNDWGVSFTPSILYQNSVNPVYSNSTAVALNYRITISNSPFLNVSDANFSKITKNAMSTFSLMLSYSRRVFPPYIYQISFQNFGTTPTPQITQCKVFSSTGEVLSTEILIFLDLISLTIRINEDHFDTISFLIKCYNFRNPSSDNAYLNVTMWKNSNAILESMVKNISSLKSEVSIKSSSNVTKFYGFLYLPQIYQFFIMPSTLTNLMMNSSIYIVFLKDILVRFNAKGNIICKINNKTMPCGVNSEQALQITISQTVALNQSGFSLELHNIHRNKIVTGMTQSYIFFGYSSNSAYFDETGYLLEYYSVEAAGYSFINIIGISAQDRSVGVLTNVFIFLYLNSTILNANGIMTVLFPYNYDFNYSNLPNLNVLLYETEAATQVNLISYWYLNQKYLVIGVNNINNNTKKYTLIFANITMPWKADDYSPCFEDQFIVFSAKNSTTTSDSYVLTTLDFMNFQKINYTYCDSTCKTCANTSNLGCSSCASPLFLNNSQCLSTCPTGFCADDKNQVCRICHYSCLKCYGGTINDCASCTSTRVLQLTTLDTGNCSCLAGLNDFGNQDCQPCYNSCKTCLGINYNNCTSCYPAMGITNGICSCPDGMFNNSYQTCANCDKNCKSCNSANTTNCFSCYTNHVIFNGYCSCPANFSDINYRDQNCSTIKNSGCDYTCQSCISPAKIDCVSCSSTRNLVNGTCPCQTGYVDSNSMAQCQKCYRSCQTCSGLLENDCITCRQNRIMSNQKTCDCPTGMSDINRLDTCLLILYQNCDSSCKSCIGSGADQCVDCIDNRTVINNLCACKSNYYPINGSIICDACNFRCDSCLGPSDTNCTKCSMNHTVVSSTATIEKCQCLPGSADLDYLAYCLPLIDSSLCHPTCGSCVGRSNSQCSSCNSSTRYFDHGYCRCLGSLFETNQHNCSDCHYSCFNCSGYQENECLYCLGNRGDQFHLPVGGQCKCPAHYTDVLVAQCEYNQNVNNIKQATTAAISVIAASFLPLLVVGLFGLVWKIIDAAQLMSYMIFINIDLPLNFADFLSQLYNFNLNTIIPNPFQKLFDTDSSVTTKSTNIFDQTPPLRFDLQGKSSSFLFNAATLMLIQIAFWSVLGLLIYVNKNFQFKYTEICQKLQYFIQWSIFLQIYQGAELEFYLAIVLQIRDPSFETPFNVFSFLLMLFFFGYILAVLREIHRNLIKKKNFDKTHDNNEEFNVKYSYLWDLTITNTFLTLNNPIISSLRKIFICMSLAFGHWMPSIQIGLVFASYILSLSYASIVRPFKELRINIICIITEFGLWLLHLLFLIYYANDYANETKIIMGWVMIAILATIIFINMMGVLIEVGLNLKKLISRLLMFSGDCARLFKKEIPSHEQQNQEQLPVKLEDRTRDISDIRGLKDGNIFENEENLSDKTSTRRKDEASPVEVNIDFDETNKKPDTNNKYSLKVIDCDDLALNKTSIDEIREKELTRKTEKKPTYIKRNDDKPPIEIKSKEIKDMDYGNLSAFLNKKSDMGFAPAKLHHIEAEGIKIPTEGQRLVAAKGMKSFQDKEQSPGRKEVEMKLGGQKEELRGKDREIYQNRGMESYEYNKGRGKEEKHWKNEQDFERVKSKESSYESQKNKDERNRENERIPEKKEVFERIKIKEDSYFRKANPDEAFERKAGKEDSYLRLDDSKKRNYGFGGNSPTIQANMSKEDLLNSDSNQKPQIITSFGKEMVESRKIGEFNTPKRSPAENLLESNENKDKNNLMASSDNSISKMKPNLSYSKSTFGVNAKKTAFNHEILGLIEEEPNPDKKNKKKDFDFNNKEKSDKFGTILEKKENEAKSKKFPVQEELVFEPVEEIAKRIEKNREKIDVTSKNLDLAKGFNFFLTEKSPVHSEIVEKSPRFIKVNTGGVCVKETWSKGLDFFFLNKGEKVNVLEATEKYLKCEWKGKIGLFEDSDVFVLKK